MNKKYNNQLKKISVKDITEDFSKEVEEGIKVIILVEHSRSYSKLHTFQKYISRRFSGKENKYIIAYAKEDFIELENMNSKRVTEILKQDLKKNYNWFREKYPSAIMDKAYSFNYALDYAIGSKNAEIMAIAVMHVNDEYSKVSISPIINISKNIYDQMINNEGKEGMLLNGIITEKVFGVEPFGLIGYLTDGKTTTSNLYMEVLCDILFEYKNIDKSRNKILKYKKYRYNKEGYVKSLVQEEIENK